MSLDRPADDARIIPMPGVHVDTGPSDVPADQAGQSGHAGEAPAWGTPGPAPAASTVQDGPGQAVEVYRPPGSPILHRPGGQVAHRSVWDTPIVAPRDELRGWFADCWAGIELRARKYAIHAMRVHLYYFRALNYAPAGLWVVIVAWWRWVWDVERRHLQVGVRDDVNVNGQATINSYEKEASKRLQQIGIRWGVTLFLALMGVFGWRWYWAHHRVWAFTTVMVVPLVLGLVGSRRGQIVQPVDVGQTGGVPSHDNLVQAFYDAGVLKANTPPVAVGIVTRGKHSWSVKIALPGGVVHGDVIGKRESLAGALDYPADCLEVERLAAKGQSESNIMIHMALSHPAHRPKPPWPMLAVDTFSIFRPFTIGWDLRGEDVQMSLMWVHTLIGAAPRRGKTTLLRQVCIATLKDPRAKLVIADFGGGADFAPFEDHAEVFIHGPKLEQVNQFRALLTSLNAEYERRQAMLSVLAKKAPAQVPEGRLTEALAHRPEFAPIVVVADEFQVATNASTPDEPKLGKEIVAQWAELKKVCPKVGIEFVSATQAADDSVPTVLRNIALQRIALSVATYQASIALLGNEAYQQGYDASKLGGIKGYAIVSATPSDDFEGWLGRASLANVTVADAHAAMAQIVAARRSFQPVTGDEISDLIAPLAVAGPGPDGVVDVSSAPRPVPPILQDVMRVFPRGEVKVHMDVLADLLGMSMSDLRAELRAAGVVDPHSVRATPSRPDRGVIQKGWEMSDITTVLDAARRG